MARRREAGRGQLDRALPGARHRADVVRGLDLARVLRARARGDLQARVAERRARRAAARARGATSPRSSRSRTRRSSSCATWTARCARSTTSAGTAATSSCGPTSRARRRAGSCRQFVCKYHGWKYDLDGACTFVQQEERVLRPRQGRLRPRARALRRVGRVHLREPRPRAEPDADGVPRPDGHRARGLSVRPDDRALLRTAPRSAATGSCSWTPSRSSTTHPFCTRSSRRSSARPEVQAAGFEALHYEIDGPHRLVTTYRRPGLADAARDAEADGDA